MQSFAFADGWPGLFAVQAGLGVPELILQSLGAHAALPVHYD